MCCEYDSETGEVLCIRMNVVLGSSVWVLLLPGIVRVPVPRTGTGCLILSTAAISTLCQSESSRLQYSLPDWCAASAADAMTSPPFCSALHRYSKRSDSATSASNRASSETMPVKEEENPQSLVYKKVCSFLL